MNALTSSLVAGAEPTMTSLEIAELTGKQHNHVMRDVKRMLEDLDFDQSKFGSVYRDAKNEERPCFRLPKDLTLTLCAGYSTPLRKKIIDRWLELEAGPRPVALPQSALEQQLRGLWELLGAAQAEAIKAAIGHLEEAANFANARMAALEARLDALPEASNGAPRVTDAAHMTVNRFALLVGRSSSWTDGQRIRLGKSATGLCELRGIAARYETGRVNGKRVSIRQYPSSVLAEARQMLGL